MNIKKLFDYSQPLVAAATVLALGAVVLGLIAASTAYKIRVAGDTVVVTGSARRAVVADFARWTIHLETKTSVTDQQSGLNRLEAASKQITAYLAKAGFTDVEAPTANVFPNNIYPQNSEPILTGYTVSRDITVRTTDLDRVTDLANNIGPLTGAGYNVSTGNLELTYQKLDQMRVELLAEAITDAKARAGAIATESGRTVGALKEASSGVVQVLPQGGVEVSDYGTYDTQSRSKDVMVTLRATFSLK